MTYEVIEAMRDIIKRQADLITKQEAVIEQYDIVDAFEKERAAISNEAARIINLEV